MVGEHLGHVVLHQLGALKVHSLNLGQGSVPFLLTSLAFLLALLLNGKYTAMAKTQKWLPI
jgi:hypothetical protein